MVVMPSVAEVLHRFIGALSVAYIEVNESFLPTRYYAEHFSAESHALFQSAHNADLLNSQEDPASFERLFALPNPFGNLVAPPAAFYDSSTYKNFFESNGIYHVLDLAIKENGRPKAIVGIFRERETAAFAGRELTYLPSLYAYLKHLRLQPNETELFQEDQGGDAIESATMVVDEKLGVQWMSAGAKDLLSYSLEVQESRAFLMHGHLPSAVRWVCQQALQQSSNTRSADDVALPHFVQPLPGGCLSVRAHRIFSEKSNVPSMIAVTLNWHVQPLFVLLRWCEQARVSERERQMLVLALAGMTGKEMARDAGIQLSTCKSYLQSAYHKLSVQDKNGFFEKMVDRKRETAAALHQQVERAAALV